MLKRLKRKHNKRILERILKESAMKISGISIILSHDKLSSFKIYHDSDYMFNQHNHCKLIRVYKIFLDIGPYKNIIACVVKEYTIINKSTKEKLNGMSIAIKEHKEILDDIVKDTLQMNMFRQLPDILKDREKVYIVGDDETHLECNTIKGHLLRFDFFDRNFTDKMKMIKKTSRTTEVGIELVEMTFAQRASSLIDCDFL